MELEQCIKKRRSIRKYKDKDISDETIKKIIEIARYAPSSHNCQNWRFKAVRNQDLKDRLSKIHKYCSFVKEASVVLAVLHSADVSFKPSENIVTPSIIASYILLAAKDLGIGSCWVFVKDEQEPGIEEEVKEILDLGDDTGVLCLVSLGYPAEERKPKKVHEVGDILDFIE